MNDNEVLLKRVLRVFRNAIIQLARERLTGKYAAGAEAQLGALFGKKEPGSETTQWDRMKLNAERARASLEVSTIVVDAFELLGVSDFFVVFEKFHDDLTVAPASGTAPAVLAERRKSLFRCLLDVQIQGQHQILAWFNGGPSLLLLAVADVVDQNRFHARLAAQFLVVAGFNAAFPYIIG